MSTTATVVGKIVKMPYIIDKTYVLLVEAKKNYRSDTSDFIEVVLWEGKYLQIIEDSYYLNKLVHIHGRLENVEFVENNEKKSKLVIIAELVELLDHNLD